MNERVEELGLKRGGGRGGGDTQFSLLPALDDLDLTPIPNFDEDILSCIWFAD